MYLEDITTVRIEAQDTKTSVRVVAVVAAGGAGRHPSGHREKHSAHTRGGLARPGAPAMAPARRHPPEPGPGQFPDPDQRKGHSSCFFLCHWTIPAVETLDGLKFKAARQYENTTFADALVDIALSSSNVSCKVLESNTKSGQRNILLKRPAKYHGADPVVGVCR